MAVHALRRVLHRRPGYGTRTIQYLEVQYSVNLLALITGISYIIFWANRKSTIARDGVKNVKDARKFKRTREGARLELVAAKVTDTVVGGKGIIHQFARTVGVQVSGHVVTLGLHVGAHLVE